MKKKFLSVLVIYFLFLMSPNVVVAHPGRTDSAGGHTCKTNCTKWGLTDGEYHYHSGNTYTNSKGQVFNSNGSLINGSASSSSNNSNNTTPSSNSSTSSGSTSSNSNNNSSNSSNNTTPSSNSSTPSGSTSSNLNNNSNDISNLEDTETDGIMDTIVGLGTIGGIGYGIYHFVKKRKK